MNEGRKLSAYLLCYNQAHLLPRQLAAYARQEYRPLEIILVDDGSSDGTYELMVAFARQHAHARVIRHERNKGVIAAVRTAVSTATGDFLYGGASDDEVQPGLFSALMAVASAYPDCGLVFCDTLWERGGKVRSIRYGLSDVARYFPPNACVQFYHDRRIPWIPGHATLWNLRYFREPGMVRPELGGIYDFFPAWVSVFRHGFCYVPQSLALATESESQWNRQQARNRKAAGNAHRAMVTLIMSEEFSDVHDRFVRSRVLATADFLPALAASGRLLNYVAPSDIMRMTAKWLVVEFLKRTRLYELARRIKLNLKYRTAAPL